MRTIRFPIAYVVVTVGAVITYLYLFSVIFLSYTAENELNEELRNRRQQLNLKVRTIAHRLSNDLQRVQNILYGEDNLEIVILVIACNRSQALKEHLESLTNLRGPKIPIVVSLDCGDEATREVVLTSGPNITLIENPNQSKFNLTKNKRKYEGYYRIARHYLFALDYVFSVLGYRIAIVTEDDLLLAPDFLEYMLAAKKLLLSDPTLWCISAWNDNGKENVIANNNTLLHRTDFFPGLGWMLTSELWKELKAKWPDTFWDDWMRESAQRKGRACIRPEISRTGISLRGKKGVSRGLYYEKHLKHIVVNKDFYHFSQADLSYLKKDIYDRAFNETVLGAVPANFDEILKGRFSNGSVLPEKVRLHYIAAIDFKAFAKKFGVMDDFRSGICRTCYYGVVQFRYGQHRVFLTPKTFTDVVKSTPTRDAS